MCRLAIVILNWNGSEMMRKYLPTVIRCSRHEGVEVIVADNASTDESVSMLRTEFPDTRVLQLDRNYGFAEGYNRALALVDAEYYLLLNSDVEIRQTDWTAPMLEYMDAHREVAACQPKLLKLREEKPSDGHLFEYAGAAGGFIDKYGYPYCRGRVFSTVEKDEGQYDDIVPVMWVTGAAMMVRAEVYRKAGGLDPTFFAHMEEIDLCWRLRTMGYRLVCVSASTAFHLGGATLNQGNARKTFLNFRNNLLMIYKNLPQEELRKVLRTRRSLDFLAAMQFLVKGDTANMKAVFRADREFRRLQPSYEAVREEIQKNRTTVKGTDPRNTPTALPDHTSVSILWQYHVLGRKTYRQIHGATVH